MDNLKSFIIFVSVVLTVYGSINFYIYKRIMGAAAFTGNYAVFLRIGLLILILSFPVAQFIKSRVIFGGVLNWVGAFWLGAMVYLLLIAIFFDIFRFTDFLFHWIPGNISIGRIAAGRYILGISTLIIAVMMVCGFIHSRHPIVRLIQIELPQFDEKSGEYKIAFISDLHLGKLFGIRNMSKIVDIVNELNPNVILLGGDVIDESPSDIPWAAEILSRLKAADGVFAITGNHEYYHGLNGYKKIIKDAHIRLLEDEMVEAGGTINLIGLNDITGVRQFGMKLKPIAEIMVNADPTLPVVLMHHTPVRLTEAADAKVDVMISGHTHGGQLFPYGCFADAMFKVKNGMNYIGKLNFYLSTGAGVWGPPMRIGTDSEIVLLILRSKK